MSNINLMNVTLNSQQLNTTAEKETLQFESALKSVAAEVGLARKVTDGQVHINNSKGDYITEEEFLLIVLEQNIIREGVKQMKASEERMKEILDEA